MAGGRNPHEPVRLLLCACCVLGWGFSGTQTILGCSFEGDLCSFDQYSTGWLRTNGSALASIGMVGPTYDNTLRASGVGGYLLSTTNGSLAFGPTVEPVFDSERCHVRHISDICLLPLLTPFPMLCRHAPHVAGRMMGLRSPAPVLRGC